MQIDDAGIVRFDSAEEAVFQAEIDYPALTPLRELGEWFDRLEALARRIGLLPPD